jgi:hypothetical protein
VRSSAVDAAPNDLAVTAISVVSFGFPITAPESDFQFQISNFKFEISAAPRLL